MVNDQGVSGSGENAMLSMSISSHEPPERAFQASSRLKRIEMIIEKCSSVGRECYRRVHASLKGHT